MKVSQFLIPAALRPVSGSKIWFTPMAWRTQFNPSAAMMPNRMLVIQHVAAKRGDQGAVGGLEVPSIR
jgi:hypothetical protein